MLLSFRVHVKLFYRIVSLYNGVWFDVLLPMINSQHLEYKKAQLSLTNPHDAKACPKRAYMYNVDADNTGLSLFV